MADVLKYRRLGKEQRRSWAESPTQTHQSGDSEHHAGHSLLNHQMGNVACKAATDKACKSDVQLICSSKPCHSKLPAWQSNDWQEPALLLLSQWQGGLTWVQVPAWLGNDQRAAQHERREDLEHVGIEADGVPAGAKGCVQMRGSS